MKYIKHYKVFENNTENNFDEIIKILERDCSKILDEMNNQFILYRGFNINNYPKDSITDGLYIKNVRKDRKPLSTNADISKVLNDKLYQKFGENLRTEGVFASNSIRTAKTYGRPYLFFPIGDYKYYWNPDVYDLYAETFIYDDKVTHNSEEWINKVDRLIDGYITNNLYEADKQEVTFLCDKYYVLDDDYSRLFINYMTKRKR